AGEFACHMSHRLCWQRLVESDAPHALLLEDDVILAGQLPALLAAPDFIPPDADIVRLATWRRPVEVPRRPARLLAGFALHRLTRGDFGAAAYIVHRDCAARLLRTTRPSEAPVDDLLFDPQQPTSRGLVTYQLIPAIGVQGHLVFDQVTEGVFASDLERTRRVRFDRAKLHRGPLRKLGRELARIVGQAVDLVHLVKRRLLLGTVARHVPFAGEIPQRRPT